MSSNLDNTLGSVINHDCKHLWQVADGPETGCGIEHWFICKRCRAEMYVNKDPDMGEIRINITPVQDV